MSWGETLKALNKDPNKSLDTLIKEQFSSNNSNVSTVKSDLTTVKSDLAYIKNTQLGTNLNNLLQGSTGSTVSFINKPLVDKINYLLLSSENLILTTSSSNVLAKYDGILSTPSGMEGTKTILTFTPKYDGQVTIEIELRIYSTYGSKNGLFITTNSSINVHNDTRLIAVPNSTNYTKKTAVLSVKKGQNIIFYIGHIGSQTDIGCRNFKILGDVAFKNLY